MWILVLQCHHKGSSKKNPSMHNKSLYACHEFGFEFFSCHFSSSVCIADRNIFMNIILLRKLSSLTVGVIFDHYCCPLLWWFVLAYFFFRFTKYAHIQSDYMAAVKGALAVLLPLIAILRLIVRFYWWSMCRLWTAEVQRIEGFR